jgi:hypothetical protein
MSFWPQKVYIAIERGAINNQTNKIYLVDNKILNQKPIYGMFSFIIKIYETEQ